MRDEFIRRRAIPAALLSLFQFAIASGLMLDSTCVAQQNPGVAGYVAPQASQNGVATNVGGLPPNSAGLEQPVYVASRETMAGGGVDAISSQDYADFLGGTDSSSAFEGFSGLNENLLPEIVYQEFLAANRVAVVGSEPILLGHVFDTNLLKKVTPSTPGFDQALRKKLNAVIVRKALYQKFFEMQVAGKSPKERETARAQINKKTAEMFHKDALPDIVKSMGLETLEEFIERLAAEGKTLQSIQQDWAENVIAGECIRSAVDTNPKIELVEMQDHYEDNQEDYRQRAQARFEVLTAEFSKYPSKQAAFDAIADMGNQVYFGNALEAVAKKSSSGFAAADGGQVSWTSKGALKSKVIDEAIFTLPLNKLSDILEDTDAYHIIRVIERKEEMILPFAEVQLEIKKKLSELKAEKARKEFIDKVLSETPIWTRWPDDFPGSMNISLLDQ